MLTTTVNRWLQCVGEDGETFGVPSKDLWLPQLCLVEDRCHPIGLWWFWIQGNGSTERLQFCIQREVLPKPTSKLPWSQDLLHGMAEYENNLKCQLPTSESPYIRTFLAWTPRGSVHQKNKPYVKAMLMRAPSNSSHMPTLVYSNHFLVAKDSQGFLGHAPYITTDNKRSLQGWIRLEWSNM